MNVFLLVLTSATIAATGGVTVSPEQVHTDSDWLCYDNGTAGWFTWTGTYRGVWFDLEDFMPGYTGANIEVSQIWFYHSSSYPWDTGEFLAELWNGGSTGPSELLDQSSATALHFAPVAVYYDMPVEVETDFWCIVNTELSTGGWPSLLGDNAQGTVPHSFYSDDYMVWVPWAIGAACNYFISIGTVTSLFRSTWGALKSAF